MDDFRRIFEIDSRHRILICLPCQYAVIPSHTKTHLQTHHKRCVDFGSERLDILIERSDVVDHNLIDYHSTFFRSNNVLQNLCVTSQRVADQKRLRSQSEVDKTWSNGWHRSV